MHEPGAAFYQIYSKTVKVFYFHILVELTFAARSLWSDNAHCRHCILSIKQQNELTNKLESFGTARHRLCNFLHPQKYSIPYEDRRNGGLH